MRTCTIGRCPTATQNNARLERLTAAMGEVAQAHHVSVR